MKRPHAHHGIGTAITAGFLIVLALMLSLTALGLRHISETNKRLKEIVENNNVKTELANTMQNALRERALSMHAMSILTDPFDKDAEAQRFSRFGATYLKARQQLESLPLSDEERRIIGRIRALAREAQPEVQAVVDMSLRDSGPDVFDRIRNVALPRQREIAEEVGALIHLQQRLTADAVRNADAAYQTVRRLMVLLGLAALLIGGLIAFFVSLRVSRQARQLVTQALYDPLTGLPNRSLMQDRLEHGIALARSERKSLAVALMDLNRFKEVNDTLGHNVGDMLLHELGQRLRQAVRSEDTVARMGGDEFVVILHDLAESEASKFADELLASLKQPFVWDDQNIDLDSSIGFSFFPAHAEDSDSLLRYADIAMYAAKCSGKGYAVYTPNQERVSRKGLLLKGELREAIPLNQLVLHYQPKIDLFERRVVGLEALVRWSHPKEGFLQPDSFIPLAEEAGMIGPLTLWVLKEALATLAELHAKGHRLSMGVNLSARSLHDLALPDIIAELLANCGVAAKYFTLEITESAVMANPDDAKAILEKLDGMGIMLAIDDFGTGYSSLAHLKQLPVDEIKIDKSFVIDMENNDNDAVIVRSTIDLAHNLGLRVVAEGVETKDACLILSVLGCDHSQGYYLSKPLPLDQLLEWLETSPWAMPAKPKVPESPAYSE